MATSLSCRVSAISACCRVSTQTSSISNAVVAYVVICHTKPVIATLVSKLVAMATSLRPDRGRLCLHWIAWSRKPTTKIKQRVASCHTAEVISIGSLLIPPHAPREQPISEMGGSIPCFVWTSYIAVTDWHCCFRFPDFSCIMECCRWKYRLWVRKSAKIGGLPPQFF